MNAKQHHLMFFFFPHRSVHPSLPFISFFIPHCLGFFLNVQFLSVFLDAAIRNIFFLLFDGHVPEELIRLFIRPCAAHHTLKTKAPRRKAWDQVRNEISAHCDDDDDDGSYPPMTQSQHRPLWRPPFSTFYFGSFNQFVSSALISSSARSKSNNPTLSAILLTSHHPYMFT